LKITSNALVTLVRAEQDCFKELFEAVDSTSHAGSLSSSGSEFQTVGPATQKARRPYVLSRVWYVSDIRNQWCISCIETEKWSRFGLTLNTLA